MGILLFNEEEAAVEQPTITLRDAAQIIKATFDSGLDAMRTIEVGVPSGLYGAFLDERQIWRMVFDQDVTAIRVVYVTDTPPEEEGIVLNYRQVVKDIYDPIKRALRIQLGLDPFLSSLSLDAAQILQVCHYRENHSLRVKASGPRTLNMGFFGDWQQVVKREFDDAEGMLRIAT